MDNINITDNHFMNMKKNLTNQWKVHVSTTTKPHFRTQQKQIKLMYHKSQSPIDYVWETISSPLKKTAQNYFFFMLLSTIFFYFFFFFMILDRTFSITNILLHCLNIFFNQ